MKRWIWVVTMTILLCWTPATVISAEPAAGQPLPDFSLAVPKDAGLRNYLGLSGGATFRIAEIKAQAVVIEIFSMYCPYCQKEAPVVNELYRKIEGGPLKGKVKLVGIGVGNSPFEVETFRKKYAIPFPLFPDGDFTIHRLVGEVRTPFFIVLKSQPSAAPKVVHAKLGAFEGVDAFLDFIAKSAEIK
ncbi:MAG: TlpA disulfide reductase family protein [Syntrophales bacterium]|jgi:peroxiredoxin|nr:TlpA disulfide reductase family protein [Syntrophales bacterium]